MGSQTPLAPVLSRFWDDPRILDAGDLPPQRRVQGAGEGPEDGPRRGDLRRQGLRAARSRRRGLLHRHQVVVHPAGRQRRRRQAALPGGQRRRVRTWYVQRHSVDAGHPARPGRRRDHRVVRDPGQPRVHLCARRSPAGAAAPAERGRRGVRQRIPGPRHRRVGLRPGVGGARRCRCVHLRRGDRSAGLAGGPARAAATASAVPRRRRPVRLPDGDQQRRDHRQRPVDRAQRRGLVPLDGQREIAWLHAVFAVGPRDQAGPVRGAAGHHVARTARLCRRRASRTPAEVLDARADRRHRCSPTNTSTCHWITKASERPGRCWAPRRWRSSTKPPAWCARWAAGSTSTSTSRAASARHAARARSG